MTTGVRFGWKGSVVQVSNGIGTPKSITAVTKANPAVVTTGTTHGLVVGNIVQFADIGGMTELTGLFGYVSAVPTTSSLTLANIDSTNFGTFVASSAHTPTVALTTLTSFCELTSYNRQGVAAPEIDATSICSTEQEYEIGLPGQGTASMDYNYAPNVGLQQALDASALSGNQIAIKITLPKNGGSNIVFGFVQTTSEQGSNGSLWKGTAQIKLTGSKIYLAAA